MGVTAVFHILVAALFFCSGCAATGTSQVREGDKLLAQSSQRIFSAEQLSYEQIDLGKPKKFMFDKSATVLEEGSKRQFVKGFELPVRTGAYSVSITSYKSGTIKDPAILYPQIRILDKDYQIVRIVPNTDFVFRSHGSEQRLNAVFFVNNNSHGERFLLVANRPMEEGELIVSQVNSSSLTPLVAPVPSGFVVWLMPTGISSSPAKMKASPIGEMEIELREYHLMKAEI